MADNKDISTPETPGAGDDKGNASNAFSFLDSLSMRGYEAIDDIKGTYEREMLEERDGFIYEFKDIDRQEYRKFSPLDRLVGKLALYDYLVKPMDERAAQDAQISKLLQSDPLSNAATTLATRTAVAHRFRAERVRDSAELRTLLAMTRADATTWERVSGFIERARKDEYISTGSKNNRNRVLSPLFSGIYTVNPRGLDMALDSASERDGEKLKTGQFWPTVVVGSGPSASIFTAQRRESKPDEQILTIDDGDRLGGQFAMAHQPLFRLNSRNRPTVSDSIAPLPGDKGNLNSLTPGTIEVSDLDSAVYPTQNVLATATAINTYLNSSLVSVKTDLISVIPNRDTESAGRYRLIVQKGAETVELTTDKLILASGLGKENAKFDDSDTNEIVERERSSDAPRIFTYDDFLKHFGDSSKQFPLSELAGKTISVVGDGDSAKSVIEVALGLQVRVGDSVAQADSAKRIIWWGQQSTTKDELCQNLRARYNLIALEAPRPRSVVDLEYRLEVMRGKTALINDSTQSSGFTVTSQDGISRQSDIIVLAKGYKPEFEDILAAIADPTIIEGDRVNGDEGLQQQLSAQLRPGSVVRLETNLAENAFVEILTDDQKNGLMIRYYIGDEKITRTYDVSDREKVLQDVLASGRVRLVEAIFDRTLTGDDQGSVIEKGLPLDELRELLKAEQQKGNMIYGYTQSAIEALPGNAMVGESRRLNFNVQGFGYGSDFFTNVAVGIDTQAFDVNEYISSPSRRLVSVPEAEDAGGSNDRAIVDRILNGDRDGFVRYISPGFGISYQLPSNRLRNTFLVLSVDGKEVTYIDQADIDINSSREFDKTVTLDEFVDTIFDLYENQRAGAYETAFRLPVSEKVPPFVSYPEVKNLVNEVSFEFKRVDSPKGLRKYFEEKVNADSTLLVYNDQTREIIEVTKLDDGIMDRKKYFRGISQSIDDSGSEVAELFEYSRTNSADSSSYTYEDLFNDLDDEEILAITLPVAAEPSADVNQYFADRFEKFDTAAIEPLLVPGFGVAYETNSDNRTTIYITKRTGDEIEYINDSSISSGTSALKSITNVQRFIEVIGNGFVNESAESYYFGVRIPIIKEIQDRNNQVVLPKQSGASKRGASFKKSKLSISSVDGPVAGEQTAIAKTVFGEDIYIIGPPANLELSDRESSRLRALGIEENTVAIFRYAPRNRALAELLPRSRATSEKVMATNETLDIKIRTGQSQKSVTLDDTVIAQLTADTELPYDVDLNELSAYALSAALRSQISSAQPTTMQLRAKTLDGKVKLTMDRDNMTKASGDAILDMLTSDPLFMASFTKLAASTPSRYDKIISCSLTHNGVNPYSVVIRNAPTEA